MARMSDPPVGLCGHIVCVFWRGLLNIRIRLQQHSMVSKEYARPLQQESNQVLDAVKQATECADQVKAVPMAFGMHLPQDELSVPV